MGQFAQPQVDRKVERRNAPRFGVECWAEECCDAGVYFHRVTNLSQDGFFVEKQLPFCVGQTIHVRLDLPGADAKLETRSRVINNYRDKQDHLLGAGFQFLDLDARSRGVIQAFIKRANSRRA
jgi:hypothetical protein